MALKGYNDTIGAWLYAQKGKGVLDTLWRDARGGATMPVAILYRPELKEYDFGLGHPFRGGRYEIFLQHLKKDITGDNNYQILRSDPATDEDLLLNCQKDYIDFTKEYYQAANLGLS